MKTKFILGVLLVALISVGCTYKINNRIKTIQFKRTEGAIKNGYIYDSGKEAFVVNYDTTKFGNIPISNEDTEYYFMGNDGDTLKPNAEFVKQYLDQLNEIEKDMMQRQIDSIVTQ